MRKMFAVLVLAALVSSVVQAGAAGPTGWPFDIPAEVVLAFGGSYIGDEGGTSIHRGVDLAADAGSRVRAVLAGTVTFAGSVPAGQGATMRAITVESGDVRLSYMPFDSLDVALGDRVEPGASLGLLAASGDRSYSLPHLHIGARAGTLYVDPMPYFAPPTAGPSPDGASELAGASAQVQVPAEGTLPVPVQEVSAVTGLAAVAALAPVGASAAVPEPSALAPPPVGAPSGVPALAAPPPVGAHSGVPALSALAPPPVGAPSGVPALSALVPAGAHSRVAGSAPPGMPARPVSEIGPFAVGTGVAMTMPRGIVTMLAQSQPTVASAGMSLFAPVPGPVVGASSGTIGSWRAESAPAVGSDAGEAASAPAHSEAPASRSLPGGLLKLALTILGCLCGCASLWPVWRAAGLLGDGAGTLNEDVAAVGVR